MSDDEQARPRHGSTVDADRGDRPIDDSAPTSVPPRWMVAMVVVAVMVVRWWLTRHRAVFQFRSDEAGQLGMARIISGGTNWNMFSNVTWRPGFATLIAPLHWVTDDPSSHYRAAILTNVVLGGVAAGLLIVLAARLLPDVGPRWICAFSLVASLLPGVVLVANWVWAESLVTAVFLATTLAGLRFVESPTVGRGAALVGIAALGPLTHGRLLGLVVSAVALVIWATVRRLLRPTAAIGLIGAALVLVVAADRFNAWLVDRMYTRPRSTNTVGRVLRNLADPIDVVISAAGQLWYQSVATIGLAVIGALALIRVVSTGDARSPRWSATAVTMVMLVPVAGTAAVFLSDTPQARADYVVYGRYLDAILGPVVVVGLATVFFGTRRDRIVSLVAVVTSTLATAAVIDVTRSDQLEEGRLVSHMVLGLLGFLERPSEVDLWRASAISLAIAVGLVAVAAIGDASPRRNLVRVGALVGVIAVFAVVGRSANTVIQPRLNRLLAAKAVEEAAEEWLPAGTGVLYDLQDDRGDRKVAYQFYLPDHPVYALSNRSVRPPTPYVFAPPGDPEIAAAGGVLLWTDPEVPMGLHRVDIWAAP